MSDTGTSEAALSGRADLSSALGMDLPERVMGRLFALAPRLVEIQDLGAREYGMSYARGRVVAALHALGPVKMRRLSQAVGVTPRTITGLVDALEADGWVVRQADPGDRRATIVALTPAAGYRSPGCCRPIAAWPRIWSGTYPRRTCGVPSP